ncbi:MAG: hypothetical protein M3P38_07335 [Chloroflexota bacterium]|nr:hypothetical protein [Chloroflexota bacterium]
MLKHVKRTKVDDDVRQPESSDELDRDRMALPNPLDPSHKTAFGHPPFAIVSRLLRSA